MSLLYLDTSALLRLYTREPDYGQVAACKEQADGVICHVITYVEMVSAFTWRRARKLLSGRAYQTALEAFRSDWPTFQHVAVDQQLLQDAAALAQAHTLRAYDAVHLAAAQAVSPLGLQFMTFDTNLRTVAEQVLPGQVWVP
ncbi:type II toxin-antitoxin system VapC family toxin [Deinococcus sp. MIMF12]|uniref:Type II toxin-antitoxin system VapC family toxin n=1 Tax=Deinococcus rhizophilus TaxID=3049544 RepID=A0ABT7JJN1_9DEIO|nr:type II toxin-antitoxin system VapC family toxin [Deinococcus rhizophilus]MDL2345161.1 type II toxin-antitoxin system VapC family toxin [Deinococcus rhizophilus]